MWEDEILPVFKAAHPDIKVEFAPINTNEYNAAIQSQVEGGDGSRPHHLPSVRREQ